MASSAHASTRNRSWPLTFSSWCALTSASPPVDAASNARSMSTMNVSATRCFTGRGIHIAGGLANAGGSSSNAKSGGPCCTELTTWSNARGPAPGAAPLGLVKRSPRRPRGDLRDGCDVAAAGRAPGSSLARQAGHRKVSHPPHNHPTLRCATTVGQSAHGLPRRTPTQWDDGAAPRWQPRENAKLAKRCWACAAGALDSAALPVGRGSRASES